MYRLKIYCMMQVMILFRILDFKFQKIQKWPEIHETEHGLVIWHKYAVVIFLFNLRQAAYEKLHKWRAKVFWNKDLSR